LLIHLNYDFRFTPSLASNEFYTKGKLLHPYVHVVTLKCYICIDITLFVSTEDSKRLKVSLVHEMSDIVIF